jgi:TetR/AcrR family transcriptional repressor of nem operon
MCQQGERRFLMKVSRDQMQANRLRILESASRLFREKGFEAVSVAEVMKAAGLTHGGFYGHFESKDDLIAQAVAHIFTAQDDGQGDIGAYLNAYLSPQHRDGVGEGCPTAALVADIRRQTPAARLAMTEGFRSQIDRIARAIVAPGAAASRRRKPEREGQGLATLDGSAAQSRGQFGHAIRRPIPGLRGVRIGSAAFAIFVWSIDIGGQQAARARRPGTGLPRRAPKTSKGRTLGRRRTLIRAARPRRRARPRSWGIR